VFRQSRQQGRPPAEIHTLPLLGKAAPNHDVHNLTCVERGDLLHRPLDGEGDKVVGPDIDEGAFSRPAYRRARSGDDHSFWHGVVLLWSIGSNPA
jgi:hypothetical protein